MAANQLVHAVRQQLGIGRILPLGGPADGAWITERAAAGALRAAARPLTGVRVDALRLSLADPDAAPEPSVPPPPSALPPGPLRVEAEFAATAARPVPAVAALLRETLLTCAGDGLGLVVAAVDLRMTELLDELPEEDGPGEGDEPPEGSAADGARDEDGSGASADALIAAIRRVPGVTRTAPALGGPSRGVRREGDHALVQVAVSARRRALDVALGVREAVAAAAGAPLTVAVLVTGVDRVGDKGRG
ncbi:hypothetical protein [Streptomyces sp. NPDC003077]|uniref:hypothetical protein n=1 Tax=Streptomyces sp. NPDC003077 TaxID=3154443 RepID=UPI0033B22E7C